MAVPERLYPAVSVQVRIALAAVIWSAVGVGLLVAGLRWLAAAGGTAAWAGLAVALGIGWLKARFVLARRASANVARLRAAGDGRCIGGVFPWSTWLLVVGMMGLGAGLRALPIPLAWLGLIYAAVGVALLGGSAVAWKSLGKPVRSEGGSEA